MVKITGFEAVDWRYPTSLNSDGSDAVHKDPDYSCVYVILTCDDGSEGYGLGFTLGRGNEIVKRMCEAFTHVVVGQDFENDILTDLVAFQRVLTQEPQPRMPTTSSHSGLPSFRARDPRNL
jgi:L-fuconate dehydratase